MLKRHNILLTRTSFFILIFGVNRKSGQRQWTLHIRISVSTKFQLKLAILIFWTKFAQKCVSGPKQKKWTHQHWILHIRSSLGTRFQLKLTSLKKKVKMWKTEKMNSAITFCILELVQVRNFSLNWQFWFFGPNLSKKGISSLKQIKWAPPLNSAYST